MWISIGNSLMRCGGAPASYSAEATALFARMTTQPDATRKAVIETAIIALNAAGLWSKLDALWVLASHEAASGYLNWVKSSHNCTLVGAGTFTVDRGWVSNGTTGALDTHFNASTEGVTLLQNSATAFYYSRTNVDELSHDLDAEKATNQGIIILTNYGGTCYAAVNADAPASDVITRSDGMILVNRTGNTTAIYRNKTEIVVAPATVASSAPPNTNIYLGCRNIMGSLDRFSSKQIAFAGAGGYLTATEKDLLYDIMVTGYLTSLGANV